MIWTWYNRWYKWIILISIFGNHLDNDDAVLLDQGGASRNKSQLKALSSQTVREITNRLGEGVSSLKKWANASGFSGMTLSGMWKRSISFYCIVMLRDGPTLSFYLVRAYCKLHWLSEVNATDRLVLCMTLFLVQYGKNSPSPRWDCCRVSGVMRGYTSSSSEKSTSSSSRASVVRIAEFLELKAYFLTVCHTQPFWA